MLLTQTAIKVVWGWRERRQGLYNISIIQHFFLLHLSITTNLLSLQDKVG